MQAGGLHSTEMLLVRLCEWQISLLRPIFSASFLGVTWQQIGNGPVVTTILHILIEPNTGRNIGNGLNFVMCEQGLKLEYFLKQAHGTLPMT